MLLLTEDALLVCKHPPGKVTNKMTQIWLTIQQRPVMVDNDPEGRSITGCPNYGAVIKPCVLTLKVKRGYSELLRIDGKRVCLDTIAGLTDGTPPGIVEYVVKAPGQSFVTEKP
jgi:hypothetical protein